MRWYDSRESKAAVVASQYASCLHGTILDVGCSKKHIRKYINPHKYVGIDVNAAENPDLVMDIGKDGLPFPDESFDTVLCLDVLEHLNRPQDAVKEIIRVAKTHIILSLPNNWAGLFRRMLFGCRRSGKFYGFPIDYPADRHKWFFGYDEAKAFLRGVARKHRCDIIRLEDSSPFVPGRLDLRYFCLKLLSLLAPCWFRRFHVHTLWCVLRKR